MQRMNDQRRQSLRLCTAVTKRKTFLNGGLLLKYIFQVNFSDLIVN